MGGGEEKERKNERQRKRSIIRNFKLFYMIYCSRLLFTVFVEALGYACGVTFIDVDNEISKV